MGSKDHRGGAHGYVVGSPEHVLWRKRISAAHRRRHVKCANYATCRNLCKKGSPDGVCSWCRAKRPTTLMQCQQCGNRARKGHGGMCARCRCEVTRKAARIARDYFRPVPLVYVMNGDPQYRYGMGLEPDTHREVHVMSRPFYEEVYRADILTRPAPFGDRAEVYMLPLAVVGDMFYHPMPPSRMTITLAPDADVAPLMASRRLEIALRVIVGQKLKSPLSTQSLQSLRSRV